MKIRKINKKNKKGWIKVVEAFMAIVFLIGVIYMVIGSGKFKEETSGLYEEKEYEVLLKIQTNETLRQEIVSQTDFTIDSNDTGFSDMIKDFLDLNKIPGATCYTKICGSMEDCVIDRNLEGNVFTSEILITNSITTYSPRKVKMFCMDN